MFNAIKNLFGGPAADLKDLVSNGAVVIDVRTPMEYRGGHVKNSINIPLDQIGNQINKIKKMNAPIITCCKSGARSGAAAAKLKASGIEVYNGGSWGAVERQLS